MAAGAEQKAASNHSCRGRFFRRHLTNMEVSVGRALLLWLLGIPIPIIIILALLFN
jgi:hypothetical protein